MRFLIWQTAYLGDVVLTTPLIRTVLRNFPGAEVTFVGRPFCVDLFRGWDEVRVIPFSKGFLESFRMVKLIRRSDVALVPHRSLRTALIVLASGVPVRIGFDRSEFPPAFNFRVPHRWEVHEIDRNLSLLEPLKVSDLVREPFLPLSREEKEKVLKRFSLKEGSYVVVSPFSNFPLKEWHLEGWKEVMKRLSGKVEVVLTGVKEDLSKVKELEGEVRFVNLVGKTTLRDLIAVIGGSRGVIASDSSPVHIANALGVPAVTVYTATSPDYGFYPLKGGFVRNPTPCSPCSPNPKRCRTGTFECLRSPDPELVLKVCEETFQI
ncbi:MAG: glycosyltransferase family 9 protein [Aquificota bacterium]|nr:glycosyltransferase family 9 protein [Aquificota bacterium]